ncbi:SDR family NAD(P)-dependent oxidoreductase [Mesobacillus foraminis]|uniref:SDR family NAD(P)-dependent oxidoreductase n=1 Tax=Mesobacillus foraminis TaxID=279826 RepID=UPI000EF4735E|nr:3-oxoacyl-ACP reductase family protein [Mesobacillus foraminis]
MRRLIVITGAGKGIGFAVAKRFLQPGHVLVLIDVVFPELAKAELSNLAEERGGYVVFLTGDISKPLEVKSMINEVFEEFGRIDVLVNSAGILRCKESHQVAWEEWKEVIDVNLGGTWNCIREVLPIMLGQKAGRIINISSEIGLAGFPHYAAYAASKGGVIALTKALAKEYAPFGILVNSVAPGPVETDLLKYDSLEFNDHTKETIPLKRFGQPDEIARSVEFLAGEGGSYYTGQIISPNGGIVI